MVDRTLFQAGENGRIGDFNHYMNKAMEIISATLNILCGLITIVVEAMSLISLFSLKKTSQ